MVSSESKRSIRYLILAFVITYLFWGLDIVLSCLGLYVHPSYNIGIVFYMIAASSPAIAVYTLWQKESDKKGLRYFLKTVFRLKKPALELSLLLAFLVVRFGIPMLFGDVTFTGAWCCSLADLKRLDGEDSCNPGWKRDSDLSWLL